MKKLMLLAAAAMMFASGASAQVKVNGYYKKDGTYVQPHYRSNPNSSTSDNWSTKGNTNPYTGKAGTKDPYSSGSSYGGSFGSSSSSDSSSKNDSCYYNCPN